MPCKCQWGLSGLILGVIILCAAGVFYIPPAFFPEHSATFANGMFVSNIYIDLCIFWAALGACMFSFGCLYQCLGCSPNLKNPGHVDAREIDDLEGMQGNDADAPAPYIMITG